MILVSFLMNLTTMLKRLYFRFITGYRFSESDFLVTVEYLLLNQVKKPARSLVLLVFDISPPICSENLHQLLGGSTVLPSWRGPTVVFAIALRDRSNIT